MKFIDIFVHLQDHLTAVLEACGPWTHALLFLIVLCEPGAIVTPFLPGDSLLFAARALTALSPDKLAIVALMALLTVAGVLGHTLNYAIGRSAGPAAFSLDTWFLNHCPLPQLAHQYWHTNWGGATS